MEDKDKDKDKDKLIQKLQQKVYILESKVEYLQGILKEANINYEYRIKQFE